MMFNEPNADQNKIAPEKTETDRLIDEQRLIRMQLAAIIAEQKAMRKMVKIFAFVFLGIIVLWPIAYKLVFSFLGLFGES